MLDVFAERMASIAVRNASARDLRDGLVAVQLALIMTDDCRDVLPTVSLLYRAAELIGADPDHEFRAVADLAGELADRHLQEFAEREPEFQSIEQMGYTEA